MELDNKNYLRVSHMHSEQAALQTRYGIILWSRVYDYNLATGLGGVRFRQGQ